MLPVFTYSADTTRPNAQLPCEKYVNVLSEYFDIGGPPSEYPQPYPKPIFHQRILNKKRKKKPAKSYFDSGSSSDSEYIEPEPIQHTKKKGGKKSKKPFTLVSVPALEEPRVWKTNQIIAKQAKKASKPAKPRPGLGYKKMPSNLDYQEEGGSEVSHGSQSSRAGDGDGVQAASAANTTR